MAEKPIRVETRTDYVGTYTAYIYADGHVETDPANRPQNREDAQRNRRKEYARKYGRRVMEVERTREGVSTVSTPHHVRRESTLGVTARTFNEPFHHTLEAFANVANTLRAPVGSIRSLISTADIGGPLVSEEPYEDPENTGAKGPREETFVLRGR